MKILIDWSLGYGIDRFKDVFYLKVDHVQIRK